MKTQALHRPAHGNRGGAKSRAVPMAMAIGLALLSVPPAHAAELPQLFSHGEVTYLSGGIGEDEAAAMQEAAREYPLEIVLVAKAESGRRAYSADNEVLILDAHGNTVLDTSSDGPYMLIGLQPGRYTVVAEDQGRHQKRIATIAPGRHQRIVFEWEPAEPVS